ncbi:MFS transporter [Micromonospora sp. CPCC 205556]|uniref:MFS transporter n=1 Tax=Micromonospora sp. CPCC 205556 TaxID=3122398 RepID=UPI002FF0E910
MIASRLGRDYRLLWSATVASRFGDALRTPALALLAATLTRDPRMVALVTVAAQLPPLLFGLLGGVYADRWDRRRTMAAVDAARAVLVGGLAVAVAAGGATVALLVLTAALLAALGSLFDAASFAVLPSLVPADQLAAANGRLQAGTAVAGGFVGAPVAGVLFTVAAALPFALDAGTFALAALLVLALGHRSGSAGAGRPAGTDGGAAPVRRSVWREAGDGLRFIAADPVLRRITLLTAATNLAISGLMSVLVLHALEVLRVPAAAYGGFLAAAALGGLAGALGAGRLAARFGTLPALRGVLVGQTLALTGFALARHPVPGAVALAVFAAGTTLWNSLWAGYGQQRVPAHLLGRVGGGQRMAGLLTAPVGAAAAGFAGAAYGVAPVAWAAAGVFVLATGAAWTTRPVNGG